jgi:UMF1 family MFS transporter
MYDWAKSAFETSVTTAILPAWFAYLFLTANGISINTLFGDMSADTLWAYTVGGAALAVAFVSPAFGVIADRTRIKMKMLKLLTYIGAGSTFLLAFALFFPISFQWVWILVMFLLANVGLNGAGVFYNALLPHQGDEEELDSISNKAYAVGYLGGGLLLVVHLGMVMGLEGTWVIPFCMATSGMWWFGFAFFTFLAVPEPEVENEIKDLQFGSASKLAISEIGKTIKDWRSFKTLFIYMIAYFLFIDGINAVTALAGAFGIAVLGLSMTSLIMTIVVIQFVAFPAAFLFTWLAGKTNTKTALTVALVAWCVVIAGALSFAPLELEDPEEYDFHFVLVEGSNNYTVVLLNDDPFGESSGDQALESQWAGALAGENVSWSEASTLVDGLEDTRFSGYLGYHPLGDSAEVFEVGIDHPTNLGDGHLDFIPAAARDLVWQPLGISVTFQFLLLGCMAGLLLGGSQGLARSLFAKMVPETRSTEFFGFFGFYGKIAALIGPFMYAVLSTIYDSRVGVASLSILIIGGTIMMRFVDVDDGIAVARAWDENVRGTTSTTEDSSVVVSVVETESNE